MEPNLNIDITSGKRSKFMNKREMKGEREEK
jgi:hypothetical protein